jgi:signal transduction histidine kinase
MHRSIRTRLILVFIGLAVGPLLLVGAVLAWQSFTVQQQQALTSQRQEAAKVATQVSAFVQGLEEKMRMLVQVRGLNGLDRAQQKQLLSELLTYDHSFNELITLDKGGREQAHISRSRVVTEADLGDRSQADEFKVPSTTGQVYYSSVRIDESTAEPLITIALPMVDARSGTVAGVLVADVRFKPIWDLIASLSAEGTNVIYIVDAQGRVIAHADPSVVLKGTHFSLSDQDGFSTGLAGNSVVLATNKVQFGKQSFAIVAEKPASEALALAGSAAAITGIVVLIALFVAVILGLITVRRLVSPIQTLAATAEAISAGDFSRQVQVRSQDEIGALARAFNSMTAQLRQTLEGLQQNVADLEKAKTERERLIVELREASRLKSEFLSTMSHELRTPLNAVIGFTGILLAGMDGQMDQAAEYMVQRIDANSKRLLALINDVLDIAKIEAGRMEVVEVEVALPQLVDQWRAQLGILAGQKGLAFECEVDPMLPEKVYLDRERVTQVVTNLLSNAVKFTEHGKVKLALRQTEDTILIQVSDTGIGIPPHALTYIFDEFRQVDGSSRRVYGGTGLGLAIVRNLCRLMSGTISVSSTLGEGSTFTAKLPLKPVDDKQSVNAGQVALKA